MPTIAGDAVAELRSEPGRAHSFRPLDPLVLAASVAIGACMVVQLGQLVGVVERFRPPGRIGGPLSTSIGIGNESAALSMAWQALVICTCALVIAVLHRGYRSRLAFRLDLPTNPTWFVVSWVVPIANFFMPYRATKLCWEGTTPGGRPEILPSWWAAWPLTSLQISEFRPPASGEGPSVLMPPFRIYSAATALLLGGLTLIVIARLARDQRHAAEADSPPR